MTDAEEALAEMTRRNDREKKLLREENAKIISEFEAVSLYSWFILHNIILILL